MAHQGGTGESTTHSVDTKYPQVEIEEKKVAGVGAAATAVGNSNSSSSGDGENEQPGSLDAANDGARLEDSERASQATSTTDTKVASSPENAGEVAREGEPPAESSATGDAVKDEGKSLLLWMYLDGVNPTQHGPFSEGVVLRLLRTGTAHKDMMAWSQGMEEWQPLGQVSALFVLFCSRRYLVSQVCIVFAHSHLV